MDTMQTVLDRDEVLPGCEAEAIPHEVSMLCSALETGQHAAAERRGTAAALVSYARGFGSSAMPPMPSRRCSIPATSIYAVSGFSPVAACLWATAD